MDNNNDGIAEIRARLDKLRDRLKNRGGKKGAEYSYPVQLEVKAVNDDDWQVSGYISIFNTVDLTGDMILPGAFDKSLKSGRKVRFLFNHDGGRILGAPRVLKPDQKGLYGSFKISKTPLGADVRQLLLDGALDSFSFGYNVQDYEYKGDVRVLKQIDLYEASLVSIPANSDAVVTGFKDTQPTISLVEAHRIQSRLAELGRKYGRS